MKVEQIFTADEQNNIIRLREIIENIRETHIKEFQREHSSNIAVTQMELLELKKQIYADARIRFLEDEIAKIILASRGGYKFTAENEEEKRMLDRTVKDIES